MKLALMFLLSALIGCSSSGPHYAPLDIDHGQLIAPDGRVVILRGINARVAGLFDVTFDDGRFAHAISAISSSNVCFRYSSA